MHKTIPSNKDRAEAFEPPACPWGVCPHWDAGKKVCFLNNDAFFFPVQQHVNAYCVSGHYKACHYLLQFLTIQSTPGGTSPASLNRRRFVRIPGRHVFRFSEITDKAELPGRSQNDAWTVDLGTGGLRFVSRISLPVQTSVNFLLEGDATTTTMAGTGRVAWSEPLAKTSLFHTGLAFAERLIGNPVRHADR